MSMIMNGLQLNPVGVPPPALSVKGEAKLSKCFKKNAGTLRVNGGCGRVSAAIVAFAGSEGDSNVIV